MVEILFAIFFGVWQVYRFHWITQTKGFYKCFGSSFGSSSQCSCKMVNISYLISYISYYIEININEMEWILVNGVNHHYKGKLTCDTLIKWKTCFAHLRSNVMLQSYYKPYLHPCGIRTWNYHHKLQNFIVLQGLRIVVFWTFFFLFWVIFCINVIKKVRKFFNVKIRRKC